MDHSIRPGSLSDRWNLAAWTASQSRYPDAGSFHPSGICIGRLAVSLSLFRSYNPYTVPDQPAFSSASGRSGRSHSQDSNMLICCTRWYWKYRIHQPVFHVVCLSYRPPVIRKALENARASGDGGMPPVNAGRGRRIRGA